MANPSTGKSVLFANIANQAIVIASMLFQVRLYAPEQFGKFGVSAAIIQLIGIISACRFDTAIAVPKSERVSDALYFSGLFVILCTVLFFGGALTLATNIGLPVAKLGALQFLLPGIFLSGLQQINLQRNLRHQGFNCVATGLVVQALSMALTQLVLGILGFTENGLIIGFIAGLATSNLILLSGQQKFKPLQSLPRSVRRMKYAMKSYFHFAVYGAGASLLSSLGSALPLLLFNAFYSSEMAGYYLAASRIASSPVDFIGKGVSQLLVGRVSDQLRRKEVPHALLSAALRRLILTGPLPISLLAVLAPLFVPILLGPGWTQVSTLMQLLALGASIQFIVAPLTALFALFNQQKHIFSMLLTLTCVRTSGLVIGGLYNNPLLSAALYSLFSAAVYVFILVKFNHAAKISNKWALMLIGKEYALTAIISGLITFIAYHLGAADYHIVGLAAVAVALAVVLAVQTVRLIRVR